MGDEARRNAAVSGPQEDSAGLGGLIADLSLAIGGLSERMAMREMKPRIPWEACHPVWQPGQIPSSGTLDQADLFGPKDPYWWDVRSVTLWGFTAGTVTVYRNTNLGEQLAQATTPGEFTWSLGKLLAPRDHLVFGVTGLAGTVNVAVQAIEVETAWLPEYAM